MNVLQYPYRLARWQGSLKMYLTSSKCVYQYLQQLLVQVGLVKADVNRVPGGHHVVVVDHLMKHKQLRRCNRKIDF